MNKTFIIGIVAVLTTMAGVTYHVMKNQNLGIITQEVAKYQAWVEWRAKFGKTYSTEELPLRYSIFCQNYDFVQKHNAEGHRYQVGLNIFADINNQEFASYRMPLKIDGKITPTLRLAEKKIPSQLNWHTKGAVGPVYNQGQCGSCWAFSSVQAIEGLCELKKGKYTELSVQQVVDCSQSTGAQGCSGGWPQWAYEYVMQNGIETEADYPYQGVDQQCQYDASKVFFKIGGYVNVTANDKTQMLNAIQQQPLSVCIEADSSSFQMYTSGIYDDPGCGTNLDHCVLLDGYDNSGATPYWLVENSWGSGWGDNGYIYIQESDGDGICGINTWVTYPTA